MEGTHYGLPGLRVPRLVGMVPSQGAGFVRIQCPVYGGNNCSVLESPMETINCSNPCPINGGYSPWSVWSSCTRTCANGTKSRKRTCSNPAPRYGGNNCSVLGTSAETTNCSNPCPINGGYFTLVSLVFMYKNLC